jgi:hypothetical protein
VVSDTGSTSGELDNTPPPPVPVGGVTVTGGDTSITVEITAQKPSDADFDGWMVWLSNGTSYRIPKNADPQKVDITSLAPGLYSVAVSTIDTSGNISHPRTYPVMVGSGTGGDTDPILPVLPEDKPEIPMGAGMVYVRVINQSTHDITNVRYQKVATPIDGAWLEFIGHPIQIPRSGGQKLFALRPASYTFLITGHNWNPTPLMALANGKEYVIIVRENEENPTVIGPGEVKLPSKLALTSLVTAPSKYTLPDSRGIIEDEYLGSVSWQAGSSPWFEEDDQTFRGGVVYQAVVTLTPKPGYTFEGIQANSFSYSEATVTNSADSGVVTITFRETPFTLQWYVFAGGNDTNTGYTQTAPLATVDKALKRMHNEYSLPAWLTKVGEQKVSIDIKGTVNYISGDPNGMVSITGINKTNEYPAIVLQGLGAGTDTGVLDATGKRRVLYISENIKEVTLGNHLTLTGGSAGTGGGAYIGSGGALFLAGGTIKGNTAASGGGGVYIAANAAFTMSAGTIEGNTTTGGNGGGVNNVSTAGAAFTMKGGKITANNATGGAGGGVYNVGKFILGPGTISNNTASGNGGGIQSSGALTANTGTYYITGNTGSYGGGISSSGALTLNYGFIEKNTGNGFTGGGIFINGGTATINGTVINENKGLNGGGVGIIGGTLTMNGTISKNTVTGNPNGSVGGGVYILGGTITIAGGSIHSNTAQTYGGGVYLEHWSETYGRVFFKMSNTTVIAGNSVPQANNAGLKGYAVYIAPPEKVRNTTLSGTTYLIQYDSANTTNPYAGTIASLLTPWP